MDPHQIVHTEIWCWTLKLDLSRPVASWFESVVGVQWRYVRYLMFQIITRVFCHYQQGCPIVLFLVAVWQYVWLNYLIDSLRLSIYLGWYLVDILRWIPKSLYRPGKKCPVNVESLSESTTSGKPSYFEMFSQYSLATIGESFFMFGMKCAILVNRSTTTSIIVASSDSGKSLIKSVLICVQGLHANSSGCNSLCFTCLGLFVPWHILHWL